MWTFTSDSKGYMLFKDGVAQGGASTLPDNAYQRTRRHWRHVRANIVMHRETAARICAQRNREAP